MGIFWICLRNKFPRQTEPPNLANKLGVVFDKLKHPLSDRAGGVP